LKYQEHGKLLAAEAGSSVPPEAPHAPPPASTSEPPELELLPELEPEPDPDELPLPLLEPPELELPPSPIRGPTLDCDEEPHAAASAVAKSHQNGCAGALFILERLRDLGGRRVRWDHLTSPPSRTSSGRRSCCVGAPRLLGEGLLVGHERVEPLLHGVLVGQEPTQLLALLDQRDVHVAARLRDVVAELPRGPRWYRDCFDERFALAERERARQATRARQDLAPGELRSFVFISIPALGLSLAATTLNAYAPVLARALTSSRFVIGALVSGEGFVALLLPLWIGAASDRVETRLGRRLPFMVATAPIAAVALACTPLAPSVALLIVPLAVYYVAYFAYYAPYRALESDLVRPRYAGRVNGLLGMFRGAGMGCGLVGGALLFQLWKPLPFWVAAALLVATTAACVLGLRTSASRPVPENPEGTAWSRVRSVLRDHPAIRRFIVANLLWQLTETGLRAFIVLYLTRGLHKSFAFSALCMGIVGGGALVAAPVAGLLADRYGPTRVMRIMLAVFGVGLWAATFTRSDAWLFAELPIVGFGGAMALSLPYSILMRIIPRENHGASAGLFDVSGGAGSLLGPVLTGAAIDVLHPLFPSTDGYAAMWPLIGSATLLSIPFLMRDQGIEAGTPSRHHTKGTSRQRTLRV
jgi:MFS family permease